METLTNENRVLWSELRARLGEIDDLNSAAALLHWDQATYSPPGGVAARGRQLATLARLAHEKQTDPRLGALIAILLDSPGVPPEAKEPEADALLQAAKRDFQRAARVPAEFAARLSAHTARTFEAWTYARPTNDWARVCPLLEQTLDLSRELASFFPIAPGGHLADPLIDFSDPGFSAASVRTLFEELRRDLVPLVEMATQNPPRDDAILHGDFPLDSQWDFASQIVGAVGYDWDRGRMDETHHPFMTRFSIGDVRITVRQNQRDLTQLLFGALHEAGHALYEQNVAPEWENTPVAEGASSGLHESQSRLWENLVGRSDAFWHWAFPMLQNVFSSHFGARNRNDWMRAINRVKRTPIRVDADELTYNLHVLIRFELELLLLEGALEVRDLPEAWRALYKRDLGIEVESDRDGVLQDVHWFAGTIGGAFQGYTLGNILSAQFLAAARRDLGEAGLEDSWKQGDFAPLREWLTRHLYRFGRARTPAQLISDATGGPLTTAHYLLYLRQKFVENPVTGVAQNSV